MVTGHAHRVKVCGEAKTRTIQLLLGLALGFMLAACHSVGAQTLPSATSTDVLTLPATGSPSPIPPTPTLTPLPSVTSTPLPPSPSPTSTDMPWPPENWLFPDSEVVYGPSAVDFDVLEYLEQAGGFLSTYRQYLMITDWTSGADIVTRVALENSINPRVLLALMEYQSGCVLGQVENPDDFNTAMGATQAIRLDLYGQLVWAVHELSEGYYGWRGGSLTEFSLLDSTIIKPPPDTNAGTVAVQYFFSRLYNTTDYDQALDPETGFLALYAKMYGDPWERAALVEPLVPPQAVQPPLTLPFGPGKAWAYTGGPHFAFESSGPLAALDFAPPAAVTGCYQSEDWVVAIAEGLVVRSELGVVILDLDGDGHEQTGWVLMYLHIEDRHRVPLGTYLHVGDPVGHPSCEGGRATGTHVHLARKYNGEWIAADGIIPFVMDGWTAHNGEALYLGTLTRGEQVVTAHQYGSYISRISRDE
jgi:LasA protease